MKTVLNKYVGEFECESTFGGSVIIDLYLYFGKKRQFKVKPLLLCMCFLKTHTCLLHDMFINELEWCGLLLRH